MLTYSVSMKFKFQMITVTLQNQIIHLLFQNRQFDTRTFMSTRENRKSLNVLNDTLRADNATMKSRENQMISHIQTLIRSQKQLSQLKEQLLDEAEKSKIILERERFSKQDKCVRLQIQLDQLSKSVQEIDLTLLNLEEEYQICLNDYDHVLGEIAAVIQKNKVVELQLAQQKQKRSTIQTMIFDYERLERVLQEERRYFKQLSTNQQKTHVQRMKEFQSIRAKLIQQEKQSFSKRFFDRFKIGFIRLDNIFKSKFRSHAQLFFRGNFKFEKITNLGISKFKNCLNIGSLNYKKQMRRVFSSWHHNVFPKNVLNNIVQNSLKANFDSKIKIKTLNKIMQKLNSDNLNLLHLYERTKFVCSTAKSIKHKQVHLVFCRWRERSSYLSKLNYRLKRFHEITSLALLRNSFGVIKGNVNFIKRFEVASHLLTQYQSSKDLSWAMRKWRLQVKNRQIQAIQRYVENMKKFNLMQQRVKYEKRKVKALTGLQLSLSKIQLRNYFSRYYQNVKSGKIQQIDESTSIIRQKCAEARKQNKAVRQYYQERYQQISLTTIFNCLRRYLVNGPFQSFKRNFQLQKAQRQSLMLVIMKKEGKNKYLAMNQFRKNVQYFQKKQMHQVLTDLNHKMEAINQKSTKFRQALKKTIQELGNQSSKKINEVFQYTLNCQKKVFFNDHSRMSIKKKFKYFLISRSIQIFSHYSQKNVLKTIQNYCKDQQKQKILLQRQKIFMKNKQAKLLKKTFFAIHSQLKLHKKVFSKFIHAQNVMYFYRLQCALLAIMKKAHIQTVKDENKTAQQLSRHFSTKRENLISLKTDRSNLEQKLKILFGKFICFQQISQKNKQNNFWENQKRKYFTMYRKNVQNKKQAGQTLQGFVKLLEYKNYFIFWKSLLTIAYQSQQVGLKDQLGKINKKKKNFQEKSSKARTDIERRLAQQQKIHQTKQTEAKYYLDKYTGILKYYDKNHQNLEKQRYLRSIFYVWRREFFGAKKFGSAIYNILRRTQLIAPQQTLFNEFKKYDSQYKSQLICSSLLQKKHKQNLSDGFNYWRYNMRHGYAQKIRYKLDHIDDHHEEIKSGIFSRGDLYATQVIRNRKFNLKSTVFMTIKNQWVKSKQLKKKVSPLLRKIQSRRIFEAMRNWKWLLHYKKTKRSYLAHTKQNFQRGLKSDVFNCLKIHRLEIYNIAELTDNFVQNRIYHLKRFVMSKVINVASFEKNELNYERKRALHTLLMNKITRQKMIKRTVMWKWQSQLIPRHHYMCTILKSIELRILKSAFANINQKKYWNEFYIKDIADKITTEGYSDINSVTNILIKEGFDPDELKDYLKVKNQKDNRMISKAIGHLKAWPKKQKMVQAFHSWVEYVQVRKNIKKALSKVFNFSTGLGRYFNRWKKKDPAFNQILQRQSRANMLERHHDLQRLMKQYRRDIKDSLQSCQQLKQINDEHAKSTKKTVQMALSNIANSVHKGMRQGLELWRLKAKQERTQQMNQRYDELVDGIQMLDDQKRKVKQRIMKLQSEKMQLKQKCKWGQQCGQLLKKLMSQKDGLSINLAQKQHNLKIMLEDNLRLKQKIKIAKASALKLINKVREQESVNN